jgi:hypothetical protein
LGAMWLVHERRVYSLKSGLLIRDWIGSLGSGLHRERKWIRLVRGRRYRKDTGWARLGAEKGGSFLSKMYARSGEDGGSFMSSKVCSLGADLGLGLDVVYDIGSLCL